MRQGVRVVAVGLLLAGVAAGCGGAKRVVDFVSANCAPDSPITVAHPLPCFAAKQTTLAHATATVGVPLVLPRTKLVGPSNVGRVWIDGFSNRGNGRKGIGTVAVTFPSPGVVVAYTRPVPYSGHARTHYQAVAQGVPESKVVDLKGTPALVIRQGSAETGHNFGVVIFKLSRTEVRVMGHNNETTLESVALSILNRSGGSS